MQDIDQFAGNIDYWRSSAGQMDSLWKLSTAARVVVELPDGSERAAAKGLLLQQAERCGCRGDLARVFRGLETELVQARIAAAGPDEAEMPYLDRDGKGCVRRTIANLLTILQTDPFFSSLRYDEMAQAPVVAEQRLGQQETVRRWTDEDDAAALRHIEETYGICDRRKYREAMLLRLREVRFHPVKQRIEAVQWDGEARIDTFLHNWAGVEDTPYTREVSRLLFAGGIHRLYDPGCKFDYLVVLVGTEQGEGKSTLVRWLALDDRWFGEVTIFEGKEAIEQLQGAWICEASEMLALKTTRAVEAIKSFITRQRDKYRRPYAERVEDIPRSCIIVGTTNDRAFLRDKTGNRRFLPVEVHCKGEMLFYLQDKLKDAILQCWAEALARYREGELSATADWRLREDFRAAQNAAMEDDWRVGVIEAYLRVKPAGMCVCVQDLVRDALMPKSADWREPGRTERAEIAQIMDKMPGWERVSTFRHPKYGKQRGWKKQDVYELSTEK